MAKSKQQIRFVEDKARLTYLKEVALCDLHSRYKHYLAYNTQRIHESYQEQMHVAYLRSKQPILIYTKYGVMFG